MNNTIFLGKRNLKSSNTANTVGIWSLHDINEMRHYDFITAGIVSRTVIITFKESGSWLCPTGVTSVEYLVVAGGGSGGGYTGGGGGAGGFRTGTGFAVTAGNTYTITVGAGGSGSSGASADGSSSVFDSITSAGGGGGGTNSPGAINGRSGGSGGGASESGVAGSGNTPSVSPSQGNKIGRASCRERV